MSSTPTVAVSAATTTVTTAAQDQPHVSDISKPSTSIWTSQELEILRQHIDGYKAEAQARRGKYVAKKVYALIKALWVERYNEENMRKIDGRKQEWKKKKSVCSILLQQSVVD